MLMRNWNVELIRNGETIKTAVVREYDDECAAVNVFYCALDAFVEDLQPLDVIKTVFGKTLCKTDEKGEYHYIGV